MTYANRETVDIEIDPEHDQVCSSSLLLLLLLLLLHFEIEGRDN